MPIRRDSRGRFAGSGVRGGRGGARKTKAQRAVKRVEAAQARLNRVGRRVSAIKAKGGMNAPTGRAGRAHKKALARYSKRWEAASSSTKVRVSRNRSQYRKSVAGRGAGRRLKRQGR